MKPLVVGLLLAACAVSLLFAAYALDEYRAGIHTVVVETPEGDLFTVRLPERPKEDLLIQCEEDELQDAFGRFTDFLGMAGVERVRLPGGAKFLRLLPGELTGPLEPAQRAFVEVLKRHSPGRIVVLGHSECLLYDAIAAWRGDVARVRGDQDRDAALALEKLHAWFPDAEVAAYYAERDGDRLRFNPWTPVATDVRLLEPAGE
jgi:hypothetical protein